MRSFKFSLLLLTIVLISACANPETELNEFTDEYISVWEDENFKSMYAMLSTETKKTYDEESFTKRYEKIYTDIKLNELVVNYDKLSSDKIKAAAKDYDEIFIPIEVEFETLAGPVQFETELPLIYEKSEDKSDNWRVNWHPGLILPELEKGGKVRVLDTEPKRGDILDRNQMPLALNDTAIEVGIIPSNFANEAQEIKQFAQILGMSEESIKEKLSEPWVEPSLFVPLKRVEKNNSYVYNQILSLPAGAKNEVSERAYPAGKSAAHLVGYVGTINEEELKENKDYKPGDRIGKRGLEQLYDAKLKGKPGKKIVVINEDEEETTIAEIPVVDGENLVLTIDINIQEKITEKFKNFSGTAAAVEPKSGDVLALVSTPAFDPNQVVLGLNQAQWDALQNDPKLPLINRFSATFAPGSVIKPITGAIGLENGVIKPGQGIEINGLEWKKESWKDYSIKRVSTSEGLVDLNDALVRSDNIYFARKSIEMGADKYIEGLKKFGFNEEIPLEFPIKSSSISSNGKLENEIILANSSYGQGEIEMSALHLALAYTPIINEGNMVKPKLIKETKSKIWKENLISKEHADMLDKSLREVVTKGTAKKINHKDYPIAGKTGTAELKLSRGQKGSENGWFVGYPADDKNIVIAVMMENIQQSNTPGLASKTVSDILIDLKKNKIHSN